MNRTPVLLAAASMVVGGMGIVGCEQDRYDDRQTRIYHTEGQARPQRDAQVYETRAGTVVATDDQDVTAVRTEAPRGDNAAERMGLSVEDAPTGGRDGSDVTVRTRAEGGTAVDEAGRGREGSNVVGGSGLGAGSVDPLVGQTGGGGTADRGQDSADRSRTRDRQSDRDSSTGIGTNRVEGTAGGGTVVPSYDDDGNVIIREGDAQTAGQRQVNDGSVDVDATGRAIDRRTGDGRQPDPNNAQRQQTADPGAAGSITETADPGGQSTPREADPGAPGSVTSTPRSGGGNPTAGDNASNNPTAGNAGNAGNSGTGAGGNTGGNNTGAGNTGGSNTGGGAGGSGTGGGQ